MNDVTKAPELLPCPFCGAEMDDWHGQSFTHPLVEKQEDACILAGLSFSYQHSRWGTQETVRWNRRATPAALAASPEVAALIREAEARGMLRAAKEARETDYPWASPTNEQADACDQMAERIAGWLERCAAALREEKEPK